MKFMKAIFNLFKGIFIFALAFWFIEWFLKMLFHPKWGILFWVWLILAIIHFFTYKSDWPQ